VLALTLSHLLTSPANQAKSLFDERLDTNAPHQSPNLISVFSRESEGAQHSSGRVTFSRDVSLMTRRGTRTSRIEQGSLSNTP